MNLIDLYTFILDQDWCARHSNVLGELWDRYEHEDGSLSYCVTATSFEAEQYFIRIVVSKPPNGEPQTVRFPYSSVVAILDLATRDKQTGFIGQNDTHD